MKKGWIFLSLFLIVGCIGENLNENTTSSITTSENPQRDFYLETDRESYIAGQTIEIKIHNNGDSHLLISYPSETQPVYITKNDENLKISEPNCLTTHEVQDINIEPYEVKTLLMWNQKHYVNCDIKRCSIDGQLNCDYTQAEKGRYTLHTTVLVNNQRERIWKEIWLR